MTNPVDTTATRKLADEAGVISSQHSYNMCFQNILDAITLFDEHVIATHE